MRSIILALALGLTSAVPALASDFPIHANDLAPGERIVTVIHATGGGSQTAAKDLRILRWIADNNWSNLKAGKTDQTVNANYLIYGRPVYAMAGGTVIACWRNAPENTGHSQRPEVLGSQKIYLQGNHLWIKQADGRIALYAHGITGDIPASLCPKTAVMLKAAHKSWPTWTDPESIVMNGAKVTTGQLLYHAGNSGNSSEPHLHAQLVTAGDQWQPMLFDRGQTTPFAGNTASLNGPWTRLKGNAVPMATILVWPPHPVGNWTYNGIDAASYQRVFDHFVDSGVMADTVTCKNNGASYDTTWVPAKGAWVAHHGMSSIDFMAKKALYAGQGYKLASAYTCGSVSAAVWRKA